MRANLAAFTLAAMCRVLGLSTSGYNDWLRRPPSARALRDAELKGGIEVIWRESDGTYGSPRIHAALRAEGERGSRKRVARLMRELGIEGVTRRRFRTGTTKKDPEARPAPDLVNRDFSADGPDRLWVADITYVPTWGAGCTWRSCWTPGAGGSSAGRWLRGCRPRWSRTRWRWRSRAASRRVAWSTIATRARSPGSRGRRNSTVLKGFPGPSILLDTRLASESDGVRKEVGS